LQRLRARLPDKTDRALRSVYDYWIEIFDAIQWPSVVNIPVPTHMCITLDNVDNRAELILYFGEARRVFLCYTAMEVRGKWGDLNLPGLYVRDLKTANRTFFQNYMLHNSRMIECELRNLSAAISTKLDKIKAEPEPVKPEPTPEPIKVEPAPTLSDWILERLHRYLPPEMDRSMRSVYDHWITHFKSRQWTWPMDAAPVPVHMCVYGGGVGGHTDLSVFFGESRRISMVFNASYVGQYWYQHGAPVLRAYDPKTGAKCLIGTYELDNQAISKGEMTRIMDNLKYVLCDEQVAIAKLEAEPIVATFTVEPVPDLEPEPVAEVDTATKLTTGSAATIASATWSSWACPCQMALICAIMIAQWPCFTTIPTGSAICCWTIRPSSSRTTLSSSLWKSTYPTAKQSAPTACPPIWPNCVTR
jgi:hypothetical protein